MLFRSLSGIHFPSNVKLMSDLSFDEMDACFRNASIYFSPVNLGSGMKTKVAEAISYGLPVVASEHSVFGYEVLEIRSLVFKYRNLEDASSKIKFLLRESGEFNIRRRKETLESFNEFFSHNAFKERLKNLVVRIL